jgi:hypothetical protein
MSGSKNMSYDSASLTTPDIKWLGVRPSDLNKYKVTSCTMVLGVGLFSRMRGVGDDPDWLLNEHDGAVR